METHRQQYITEKVSCFSKEKKSLKKAKKGVHVVPSLLSLDVRALAEFEERSEGHMVSEGGMKWTDEQMDGKESAVAVAVAVAVAATLGSLPVFMSFPSSHPGSGKLHHCHRETSAAFSL